MTVEEIQIKVNDVFSFRYNEAETKKRFMPYHCFDGQLIVRKEENGDLYLKDTYWGSGTNRCFTLDQALKEGVLTLKCNLNDVEKIEVYDLQYYADEDLFDISHQHHSYVSWVKKKGAVRSKDKMILSVCAKIEKAERDKSFAESSIEHLTEALEKIKAGDTSVYI